MASAEKNRFLMNNLRVLASNRNRPPNQPNGSFERFFGEIWPKKLFWGHPEWFGGVLKLTNLEKTPIFGLWGPCHDQKSTLVHETDLIFQTEADGGLRFV